MHYLAIRAALHIASVFGVYLSAAMLIPAAVDLYFGNDDWRVFAFSALFSGGLAIGLSLATQGRAPAITSRFGFLVVNLLWLTGCAVGSVPFLAASVELSLADAFFESVSGITATGATVIVGLDNMPPGILLWRSILQWIGGLGVIALGLFVLPFLNVGGVSYFRIEFLRYRRPPLRPLLHIRHQPRRHLCGADAGLHRRLHICRHAHLRCAEPRADHHRNGRIFHP